MKRVAREMDLSFMRSPRLLTGKVQPALAAVDPALAPGGAVSQRVVTRSSIDAVRMLVAASLLGTTSHIHQHFPFLSSLRPILLLVILAVFVALLNRESLRTEHLWTTKPPKLIAGLAIMACISAVGGISLGGSASFILFEYSKVLILAFLLILSIRNSWDLLVFVWAYVVAAGVLSYLSIFVFPMNQPSSDRLSRIISGYAFDANDIGLVVLIGFSLSLLTFNVSGKTGRLVSTVVMVGIGITLAKTGSRGAFVGLIGVALAIILLVRTIGIGKRVGLILIPAAALFLAAPAGYWDQMNTIRHPQEDYNWNDETGRMLLWQRGMEYMMSRPLTGIGIDNFARAEGTRSERAINWNPTLPGIRWSAAHNSFLQAASEMGVPGMVLFTSLVLSTILLPLSLRRRIPRSWVRGDLEQRFLLCATNYLPVAGIAFATSGFFVSFAYIDPVYILGAFAAGLTTCTVDRLDRERRTALGPEAAVAVVTAPQVSIGGPEWWSRR